MRVRVRVMVGVGCRVRVRVRAGVRVRGRVRAGVGVRARVRLTWLLSPFRPSHSGILPMSSPQCS